LKRTFLRLLVAIATFLIGTASHRVFNSHEAATPVPQSEWVRVTPQVQKESPEQRWAARPEVVFDYDPTEFNPRGDYFMLGRKPKAFREFDCLELAVDDDSYGRVSGAVMISTYNDKEGYGAIYGISGVVTKQRISLVGKPVFEEDVGYRFEGEFLRHGELWRTGKSQAVLKGRLSKIKGGKTIAEAVVKFRIEYLGC
jgi:hypothetical protein